MTDEKGDKDIKLCLWTDAAEKKMILEGGLLMESNNNLAAEQHELPAAELCTQVCKSESLLAASEVGVIKQMDSKVQDELDVTSPQCTPSEVNGNIMPCVTLATPAAQGNLDAVKSSNVSMPEMCDITLVSPTSVTGDQEMEVSVSARLETLSFQRSQFVCQKTEHTEGEQLGQSTDFPRVNVMLQDVAAEEEDSEDDESSSSEDTSTDSDSDSTSSSSSSAPSAVVMSDGEDDDQEPGDKKKPQPIKTKDELFLADLPKTEEVNIVLPEEVAKEPIGVVSSIIDQLVIVESLKDMPPVNEETILFKRDNTSVGKVFEVFGPVSHPFYVLRFNSIEDITAKEIKLQEVFYFAPAVKDFTQYIFTEQLKHDKGSDASWRNDQEPPREALDFSDDEKEREAKQKMKKKKQQNYGDKNTQCALAFLPVEDVEEAYEDLIDDEEIPAEFIVYFDLTYIGIVRGRGARRRSETPTFPTAVWNVNQRVLQDLPRTNNAAEGFHSAIKHSAGGAHLNIWRLIKTLKEEEGFIIGKKAQILRGDQATSCTRYKKITERLKRLVVEYDPTAKIDFLRNVAHNLHQF